MESETIDLFPKSDGKFAVTQMTLDEEHYCRLVAQGMKRRAAYRLAFNKPNATDNAIDQWLHRVRKDRPEFAARIDEYKASVIEELREQWLYRQWEALERLWTVFLATIGDPKLAMVGVKCYQLIAATVGWTPSGTTTSVTINNANTANASAGALPQADANAKIQKLLELTAPKEGEDNATN